MGFDFSPAPKQCSLLENASKALTCRIGSSYSLNFGTVTVGVTAGKIIVVKMEKETNREGMLTCIQRSQFAGKIPPTEEGPPEGDSSPVAVRCSQG